MTAVCDPVSHATVARLFEIVSIKKVFAGERRMVVPLGEDKRQLDSAV